MLNFAEYLQFITKMGFPIAVTNKYPDRKEASLFGYCLFSGRNGFHKLSGKRFDSRRDGFDICEIAVDIKTTKSASVIGIFPALTKGFQ